MSQSPEHIAKKIAPEGAIFALLYSA